MQTIKIPTVFTAVDRMSSVVSGISKNVSQFSRKSVAYVERFDQKINRTFSKMNRFAQIGLGVGVAGLFNMAIQSNLKYEDSLASVSAITGAVGSDLIVMQNKSLATAKAMHKTGDEVLKAYELIGSAKPELLQNADLLDQVTRSSIILSQASRMDLATSATALTDVMNQFNIAGGESAKVIDFLAAGAKYGAAAIPLIQDAILGFGATATAANVNLRESVALVETFAAKGIKGAEAGTKLRNVLTKMSAVNALPPEALRQLSKYGVSTDLISNKQLPLIDRLKELSKISGDATALVKVFGLENKDAAQILLQNLPAYQDLVSKLGETGTAQDQAAKNSQTLTYWINAVKDAFSTSTTATEDQSRALKGIRKFLKFVAENMEEIVFWSGTVLLSFVALKVVVGIIKGIRIATKLWTFAQKGLNTAFKANPIGATITAITLLIGIVSTAIQYYDSWGATLLMFLGPLGTIVILIKGFIKHWSKIKDAFKEGGIIAGIKMIGKVIIDSLLYPMEQFLGFLEKIPGVGKYVKPALDFVKNVRENNGLTEKPSKLPENFKPSVTQNNLERIIESPKFGKGQINLNVNDPGKNINQVDTSGDYNFPMISSTQGNR